MSDKIVIIGGSGFVGSHTADYLSELGNEVVILDRKKAEWLRPDQLFYEIDLNDSDRIKEHLSGARFVYHFAGIADIGEAKANPNLTLSVNIMGTASVLEACVDLGIERFIYASTMYVYSPYGSFYRASKQAAEIVIESYHEHYDLDYTILRYGSLYGPRSQEWNGLHKYISEVVKDKKLIYRGTGKERREYIHVQDAAQLSIDILDEQYINKAITVTGNQILNSEELIDMIFEIAGVKKNVDFSSDQISEDHYRMTPYRYTPKKALKLTPTKYTDIGQGILEIVEEISSKSEDK
tara:strand:+ start:784 stop:1668 length:885 start_codon:yes stop_codon:yes gene_type:complete